MVNELQFKEVKQAKSEFTRACFKSIEVEEFNDGLYMANLGLDFECGHGDTPEEALKALRQLLVNGISDVDELLGTEEAK